MVRDGALMTMGLRPVVSGTASVQPDFARHRLGVRDASMPQSGHTARLRILNGFR